MVRVSQLVPALRRTAAVVMAIAGMLCSCAPESGESAVGEPSTTESAAEPLADSLSIKRSVELDCSSVAPASVPDNFTTVLDAAALPAADRHERALQTMRQDGGDHLFAKSGPFFSAQTTLEISVSAEQRDQLAIGWGNPAQPSHRFTVDCAETEEGWLGLPGGYWITEPICALLDVTTEKSIERVEIGLGTPCPGQLPPAESSDT